MKLKKILSSLAIILALSAFTTLSFPDDSEAKRFGGRRSIGRTVTPKSTPPAGANLTQQQRQNPNQSQAVNAGGASAMSRTGMFGGMFGGLLAGTLLGSLLMGGGLAGGGFLDIIIIGLIAFFAFRFFKSRSANSQSKRETPQKYEYKQHNDRNTNQDSHSSWDRLRSEPNAQDTQNKVATQNESSHTNVNIPASFNEQEFLPGAKSLYIRMQESWDERDLDDIAQFTTPTLFAEIREQFNEDPTPSKTEILLVEASVIEVNQIRDEEHVSVLFDVHMREENESEQIKEIWNFTKTTESNSWKLDGIQQV